MVHIKIPLPEKVSTNKIYSGMHWTKRSKLKDLYHNSLLPFRKMKHEDYPAAISYIFTFKSKPLDTTNCTFMCKMLEDGLIANGIIKNDDYLCINETSIIVQKGETDEVEVFVN